MIYLSKISALAENHYMPNEKGHFFYHAAYFIPITKSFQGNSQDVTNKKHYTHLINQNPHVCTRNKGHI